MGTKGLCMGEENRERAGEMMHLRLLGDGFSELQLVFSFSLKRQRQKMEKGEGKMRHLKQPA